MDISYYKVICRDSVKYIIKIIKYAGGNEGGRIEDRRRDIFLKTDKGDEAD